MRMRLPLSFFIGIATFAGVLAVVPLSAADSDTQKDAGSSSDVAADELRELATAGDKKAAFNLANEYFYGTKKRKANPVLAVYWYRKAADAYPEAMFNYGICLEQGLGIERDPVEAVKCYKAAAEKNCKPAQYNYALFLKKGISFKNKEEAAKFTGKTIPPQDSVKAMSMLKRLADEKYVPAMVEYAAELISKHKDISVKTAEEAFKLAEAAAQSPDAPARVWRILGDCYFSGIGTIPDGKKMIECLEQAEKRGSLEAMTRLGYCYENGINVKEDQKKALAYYRKGAEAGFPAAMLKYGDFIAQGKVPDMGVNDAIAWFEKSAMGACPEAFYRLGVYALSGIGMEKNTMLSYQFFYDGAKLGHLHAQYELAKLYLMDKGPVVKDESTAFYWFEKAALQGEPAAQYQLSVCYSKGIGCKPDTQKAMEWMRQAALSGNANAIRFLQK